MTLLKQTIRCSFPLDQIKASPTFKTAWSAVQTKLHARNYPFIEILKDDEGFAEIGTIADLWKNQFKQIVILGTGGSSLGGKTLVSLKQNPFMHTKLIFLDNVDPKTLHDLMSAINLDTTGFIVISKSGTTAETLCQFLCILKIYQESPKKKGDIAQHFLIITEPKPNTLRVLGENLGCQILDHSPHIGGRFSVFSNVGLLPASIANIDIKEIRQGARDYCQSNLEFVADAIAMQYQGIQQGFDTAVMMPYIDILQPFSAWYCQLWAESLGKNGKGTTPVRALGTVDQHSQLQLYRDGPQNKCFTFIYALNPSEDYWPSPVMNAFPELNYLQNKSMGNLLEAEMHATSASLINQGCPTRLIALDQVCEKSLGALLAHFMLETIFMAELLQVNAFDQPGVEESKILTRQFLKERFAS